MYVHQQQVTALMVRIATLESTVYRRRHKATTSKEEPVTVNTNGPDQNQTPQPQHTGQVATGDTPQSQPFDEAEHRTPTDPDKPIRAEDDPDYARRSEQYPQSEEPQPFYPDDETAVHYTGTGNDPLLYP